MLYKQVQGVRRLPPLGLQEKQGDAVGVSAVDARNALAARGPPPGGGRGPGRDRDGGGGPPLSGPQGGQGEDGGSTSGGTSNPTPLKAPTNGARHGHR